MPTNQRIDWSVGNRSSWTEPVAAADGGRDVGLAELFVAQRGRRS